MPSSSFANGTSSVRNPFTVVVSDYDGADIVEEVMGEFSKESDEPECQGSPVPVYSVTGSLGAIHSECMFLYMIGGVPLIMVPSVAVIGTGKDDAKLAQDGGHLISSMYTRNNSHVYSIGYVDDPMHAYAHAVDFTSKQIPYPDSAIDAEMVNAYLADKAGSVNSVGTIFNPGGTRFDVYAFSESESMFIRPDKDFMGGEPYEESGPVPGGYEVILVGGDPDVVCIGGFCTVDGCMFDVWVPNEKWYVECARNMMAQGDIPFDTLFIDYDAMYQAYDMFEEKLRADEEKADESVEPDTDVPDFDYDEYFDEVVTR